jgi:putative addiction module CopG family antidote
MKISISLSDEDVQFIDTQAGRGEFSSRSAVIRAAIHVLRDRQHTDSYAAAWDEWDSSGDDVAWDSAVVDGLK